MSLHFRIKPCLLGLLAIGLLGGCALSPERVEPWEMDTLARGDMALEVDPLSAGYRRHIQFSKEATTGGASESGGGCGCN